MNTLKNIVLGTVLAGTLMFGGCGKTENKDSRIPEVRGDQSIILHPDYLKGYASLGYTLLTDVDRNGTWDVAERVHSGFSPIDYSREIFFRKGFGPSRSIEGVTKAETVNDDFFKSYQ